MAEHAARAASPDPLAAQAAAVAAGPAARAGVDIVVKAGLT
jgi:hypothetical protein